MTTRKAPEPIVTRVGAVFMVTLPSYLCSSWTLTPENGNVKQIGKPRIGALPQQTDKRGDHILGAMAPTIFAFKAIKEGRCNIKAAVYQLSEKRPMGRETIRVDVKPR